MPKDNEVDEKVALWHMRTNPITGGVYMATDKPKGDPSYEYVRYDDHAATVAELREEVEKARIAGIDACEKLTALWQKDIDRADAAERRVGELEAKARNWDDLIAARAETARDPDDAEWKMLARQGRKIEAVRACRALHGYSLTEATHCVEALTGADPT